MWKYYTYNELYHEGILGMKWGVRNGPPYPLGKVTSARIKRNASQEAKQAKIERNSVKKSNPSEDEEDKKSGLHLTDKQKKYIKIGAAVVGTALVAVGTYELYKRGKLDGLIQLGNKALKAKGGSSLNAAMPPSEKITAFAKKNGFRTTPVEMTNEAIRNSTKMANADKLPDGYCGQAVLADICTRLGMPAKAASGSVGANGLLSFNELSAAFTDRKRIPDGIRLRNIVGRTDIETAKLRQNACINQISKLCEDKDRSLGFIQFEGSGDSVGHFIKFEKVGSDIVLSDSLTGGDYFLNYFYNTFSGKFKDSLSITIVDPESGLRQTLNDAGEIIKHISKN